MWILHTFRFCWNSCCCCCRRGGGGFRWVGRVGCGDLTRGLASRVPHIVAEVVLHVGHRKECTLTAWFNLHCSIASIIYEWGSVNPFKLIAAFSPIASENITWNTKGTTNSFSCRNDDKNKKYIMFSWINTLFHKFLFFVDLALNLNHIPSFFYFLIFFYSSKLSRRIHLIDSWAVKACWDELDHDPTWQLLPIEWFE